MTKWLSIISNTRADEMDNAILAPLNYMCMHALSSKDPHFLLHYLQLSAKDSFMENKRHIWLQEQADECLNHSLDVLA